MSGSDDSVIIIDSSSDDEDVHVVRTVTKEEQRSRSPVKSSTIPKSGTAQPSITQSSRSSMSKKTDLVFTSDEDDLLDLDDDENSNPKPVQVKKRVRRDDQKPSTSTSALQRSSSSPSTTTYRVRPMAEPGRNKSPWRRLTTNLKEQEKLESEQKKMTKAKEKDDKKRERELEKVLKRAQNELVRNQKSSVEGPKCITLLLDAHIPNLADLTPLLEREQIKYEVFPKTVCHNSIMFKREQVFLAMRDAAQQPERVTRCSEEDQVMIIMNAEDFVPKIYIQVHQSPSAEGSAMSYVKSVQAACPGKVLTLIIVGLDKYFKKINLALQRAFRDRVRNIQQAQQQSQSQPKKKRKKDEGPLEAVTEVEFKSCMVELEIHTQVIHRLVKSQEKLVQLLKHYVKAIWMAPFDREKLETGYSWYVEAETLSKGSVKVETNGEGLDRLWIEQLKMFARVGIETAQAIAQKYPSPNSLIKAYDLCESPDQAKDLLSEIKVWTTIGPLVSQRKLGKALSQKIHRFFTSSDPDKCLGDTN